MKFNVNIYIHIYKKPMFIIKNFESPLRDIHMSYHEGQHYNSIRKLGDVGDSLPQKISLSSLGLESCSSTEFVDYDLEAFNEGKDEMLNEALKQSMNFYDNNQGDLKKETKLNRRKKDEDDSDKSDKSDKEIKDKTEKKETTPKENEVKKETVKVKADNADNTDNAGYNNVVIEYDQGMQDYYADNYENNYYDFENDANNNANYLANEGQISNEELDIIKKKK